MERLVKGEIVVIPFPFSDLSSSKKRPALVLASLEGDDLILCQITSEARFDNYAIGLKDIDFKQGRLNINSFIRPNKLFTADKSLIQYKIGSLKDNKLKEVITKLIEMFKK
ncbi:MAG: type II toxin-antitoxin system PemK/MazF family toxin [Nanoarchaeota archaeon]